MRPRQAPRLAACIAMGLAVAVAGASPAAGGATVAPEPRTAVETGVASWYGPNFNGRRTSNGEIYDKERLSAAHRTLPFGSYVLVQNLDNGSSVVVRVNDRGPFAKNRVIDLSEAAARIIGMIPTGTARVSLIVVPEEEALAWKGGGPNGEPRASGLAGGQGTDEAAKAATIPGDPEGRVRIQVASYASQANAEGTRRRLELSGLSAAIERAGDRFRVVFPDLSVAQARIVSQKLDGLGYRGYTVTTIQPVDRH